MATLIDRAYLEAGRSADFVAELLSIAYQPSDDQPTKDAKAQERLDAALGEADAFLRRFIDAPLEWTEYAQRDRDNVKPLARAYAINWLRRTSRAGSNDQFLADELKTLTMDAAKLRERGMWSGSTVFQQPTRSEVVSSESSFRRERLRGLI